MFKDYQPQTFKKLTMIYDGGFSFTVSMPCSNRVSIGFTTNNEEWTEYRFQRENVAILIKKLTEYQDKGMEPYCHKCSVPMRLGKALQDIMTGSPDFPGDTGNEPGCTISASGNSKLVPVWKCPNCGHSFTI